jgi:hypothetical protein
MDIKNLRIFSWGIITSFYGVLQFLIHGGMARQNLLVNTMRHVTGSGRHMGRPLQGQDKTRAKLGVNP